MMRCNLASRMYGTEKGQPPSAKDLGHSGSGEVDEKGKIIIMEELWTERSDWQ